ncbi:MAG: hypothetical protein AAGK26_13235, partial [Pseudomonadota bacterium]
GVGRPFEVWRNGAWQTTIGWTDRKMYQLRPDLRRAGYCVDVPDITLLPERTGANSVVFRAGLELRLMNWALQLLAKLRQYRRFDLPRMAYSGLHLLAKALHPFGSDRGGMEVSVSGKLGGGNVIRKWTLVAENGHGPFVPGIMCRAILREHKTIKAGARPCLAELSRPLVEGAMSDLEIQTELIDLLDQGVSDPQGGVQGHYMSKPTAR